MNRSLALSAGVILAALVLSIAFPLSDISVTERIGYALHMMLGAVIFWWVDKP